MQPSRCTIPTTTATDRIGRAPLNLHLDRPTLGPSLDRSLCITQQPSTPNLCHLELSPTGGMGECLFTGMASSTRPTISCSTVEHDSPDTATTDATPAASHSHHAQLALSPLVPASSPSSSPSSSTTSAPSLAASLGKRRSISSVNSEEYQMDDACLEPRPKRARQLTINAAARTLLDSSHLGSKRQYAFRQQAYRLWCDAQEYDYLDPSPT
ncbi:uncharacterized protein RHIMIDRAFT_295561 [Rhizopus microsporus ATCC 52813]|uniref:Uncharacterized protein n=1 Tax=Rhizopus microsporus ATCC 52813 TaxID=1340429 RepID=A0A2G4SGF0_RHIZD|nr:uncharacterized protein RHIMIDRAFT_295561 [Rhizopus microsporus ATCC 52813]PHZ07829.1 hypothetical protein RHIMIDRAFT_295561 [Rhizopus microsporus ATCC 52813]